MNLQGTATLLSIYIGDDDHLAGKPLAATIVARAKKDGMAGATVTHGSLGFGATSRNHATNALRLSSDLPTVVQIIDTPERIAEFMPAVREMVKVGLITTESVNVEFYAAKPH